MVVTLFCFNVRLTAVPFLTSPQEDSFSPFSRFEKNCTIQSMFTSTIRFFLFQKQLNYKDYSETKAKLMIRRPVLKSKR